MSKKREAILNTATILFSEKGFNETSIAELAQFSKVAEGTIFYHFKTKADVFLAILENVKNGITREFDQYIGQCNFDTGLQMMEEVVAFFLYLASHHEAWFRLLHRHYPYEFARSNNECRSHLEAIYNTLIDLFEGAIHRGHMDGSISKRSPRKTALLIFSMVNGLIWLKFHDLYDISSLYQELLTSCRGIFTYNDQ
ncbi:MAG: TetR/AcrR family transcriptional regulator [Deltaproteobacteria bacterium]|nr:TetR/AcrR family transcriptional regulator [Deltaproteobacteria bacterium]